jgi:hypothetical protein
VRRLSHSLAIRSALRKGWDFVGKRNNVFSFIDGRLCRSRSIEGEGVGPGHVLIKLKVLTPITAKHVTPGSFVDQKSIT